MSGDAFGFLIAPVATDAFFATAFEREVLHVARDDPAYFAGLYGIGSVEDALALGARAPEHFTAIKAGAPPIAGSELTGERDRPPEHPAGTPSRFTELDPRRVLRAFADGYTINVTDAGAFHPQLARFCNRVQAQLGFFTQANAYLTPPGAQGFELHYDTHDTLIAQLDGAKAWTIYEPVVQLPLATQPFAPERHAGRLGAPRTVRLEPGDSLYIPRGFPHHAASTEHRSLHLTFALSATRAIDLLDALLRLASLTDVELRRALPPGWQHDPAFPAQFSARLAALVPRALVPDRVAPAAELIANDRLAATRALADGAFDALAAALAPEPGTRLTLRDDTPFAFRDRGERLDLALATDVAQLPGSARAALARLAAGPATYAEIAALLPGEAPHLVVALASAGLLQVEPPA